MGLRKKWMRLLIISLLLFVTTFVALYSTIAWQEGVFAGSYRIGFEISDFRPVGTNEHWWMSEGDNLRSLPDCPLTNPCHLVVRGQLSGSLGPHGHLGAYKRELRVTEVIEQRPLQPDEKVAF